MAPMVHAELHHCLLARFMQFTSYYRKSIPQCTVRLSYNSCWTSIPQFNLVPLFPFLVQPICPTMGSFNLIYPIIRCSSPITSPSIPTVLSQHSSVLSFICPSPVGLLPIYPTMHYANPFIPQFTVVPLLPM